MSEVFGGNSEINAPSNRWVAGVNSDLNHKLVKNFIGKIVSNLQP